MSWRDFRGIRTFALFAKGALPAMEHSLLDPTYDSCDILVCSDDDEARAFVVTLVAELGLRGWQAGPLANSVAVEGMTSVLITINRKYRIQGGAGIRVSGHA